MAARQHRKDRRLGQPFERPFVAEPPSSRCVYWRFDPLGICCSSRWAKAVSLAASRKYIARGAEF
jgi:hypothetical protein